MNRTTHRQDVKGWLELARSSGTPILVVGLALGGCDIEPNQVYVPDDLPTVIVEASISANDVLVGEALILSATRYNHGDWKLVDRRSLVKDSCWVHRPPPKKELEVADNIHWTVHPTTGAQFNIDHRSDHTRVVIFSASGRYQIRGRSSIWCGQPQDVLPSELEVIVRERGDA